MRRREFIELLGGAALAWPVAARGQTAAKPVIGFLSSASPNTFAHLVRALKKGLGEVGYVDGDNVSIEYRWAEDHYDRLPAMAAELVRRQVAVIVASGGDRPALVAKAATKTIPIVFPALSNPVKWGLVASLNRPGGNITGVDAVTTELDPKRLELLRELVPNADIVGVLMDSNRGKDDQVGIVESAAQALGRRLVFVPAGRESDFDTAFAALVRQRAGALLVTASAFFTSQRSRLVELAARHSLPAMYQFREFAVDGGLISYGASAVDSYRQAGVYVGRILKGEKPADLPVVRPTKFELVINLKTAKALGLTVPSSLRARADELIE